MSTEIKPFYQGKVRDLYQPESSPDTMVIVASDRISAFDVIFREPYPDKGKILTGISNHWFHILEEQLEIPNHLIETDALLFPDEFQSKKKEWENRAVWVRRYNRIDFECVVRGYIIGSGWKEYQKSGSVCGIKLPQGLQQAQKLESAIFTPATKAEVGHDENVSFTYMADKIGEELSNKLQDLSVKIYNFAAAKLMEKGIILADTKFEFGLDEKGEIFLIDEVLTPDSSRFWDASEYKVGSSPASYDKQILRDYLETLDWDKTPPPPALPQEIIDRSLARYKEIESKILTIR